MTPVRLPPGRLELLTSPKRTWIHANIEDNGNGCRRRFRGSDSRAADRRYHAHSALHQLGRELREALVTVLRPKGFERHVAAFHIATLGETLMETLAGRDRTTRGIR